MENFRTWDLKGQKLDLIIMDGALDLWSAIEEVDPDIPHQIYWVHKMHILSRYCLKKYRKECVSKAFQIMYAGSPRKAANLFRKWQDKMHKAVRCIERDFDKLTPFLEFDPEFQKVIRTTQSNWTLF